jgi:ketosteroid isomerase-like protein
MSVRSPTATRWLLLMGLQVPAVLSLQSCKNDRTEPVKAEAQDPQPRAVFGSAPERGPSEIRPRTSKSTPPLSVAANRSQERARTRDAVGTQSRPASGEPQRPPVKDPGERRLGDSEVRVASNRAPREPAAERFLHYEPPGSSVGDPGEITSRIREPQISASMKPIRDLIRQWADTLLTRDLPGHMSLYALSLYRFHGSSNVSRETVRVSKQRFLSEFTGVRRFEIYEVRLLPSPDGSVIAEFRIESDAAAHSVNGWYRLQLRQVDDQWKIYGEEKIEPLSSRGAH